jgi:hypothetical protein
MDEMNNATNEVSADLNDIDMSDIDFGATDNAETEPDVEATPETDPANQQEPAEGEGDTDETEKEKAAEETDQFTLKHLDEVKTVSKEEVVTLAQKGMDYDRLKQKSEERYMALESEKKLMESRVAIFDEIAKRGGFSNVDELIENIQAEQLAQRTGVDTETALQQVRLERREKALAEKEKRLTGETTSRNKVDEDARAFVEKHPNVDFGAIPKEVWDKVNAGESLLSAYDGFTADKERKELAAENERLKAELEAAKKNADNKSRSTGSATSAGKDSVSDPWISDLESRF